MVAIYRGANPPCNMARWRIFNATFCCGNMLQQFEVDSNCCNIVSRTFSELVGVTPSPSTFDATLCQNTPRESRNKLRDQSTSAFFMPTNKMAEIVNRQATPVDTFVPQARLDDNGRRKLIAFYKEKPIFSLVAKYRKVAASLLHYLLLLS